MGESDEARYDNAELRQAEAIEADVVVVGSGAAGLCAAVQAAEDGARVVLLEKAGVLGGNTRFAEGIFAVGSTLQRELGIEGDAKALLRHEYEFHNYKVNPKLWEQVARMSAGNIDWLMAHGAGFETVAATGGDFPTWHVYRGHHGSSMVDALGAYAGKLGVDIRTRCAAERLLMSDGQVAGVAARCPDGALFEVHAPAVVLATGGFGANEGMLRALAHVDVARVNYRGCAGVTGDGIRMAREAGAVSNNSPTACLVGTTVAGVPLTNSITVAGAMEPMTLWVNQDGERFVSEDIVKHYTRASNVLLTQEHVYAIADARILERLVQEGTRFGAGAFFMPGTKLVKLPEEIDEALAKGNPNVFKAGSVAELAERMGIDAGSLGRTVAAYNGLCACGEDTQYGKDPSSLVALETAPFFAFEVTANLMNTMGGVRTDACCRVLGEGHEPIDGLFAAGMECDGYSGETYGVTLPGSDQGIAVATGRVAGHEAARVRVTS